MGGVTNLIGYISAAVVVGYLLKSTDYISWSATRPPPTPTFLTGRDYLLWGSDYTWAVAQED